VATKDRHPVVACYRIATTWCALFHPTFVAAKIYCCERKQKPMADVFAQYSTCNTVESRLVLEYSVLYRASSFLLTCKISKQSKRIIHTSARRMVESCGPKSTTAATRKFSFKRYREAIQQLAPSITQQASVSPKHDVGVLYSLRDLQGKTIRINMDGSVVDGDGCFVTAVTSSSLSFCDIHGCQIKV